MNPHLAEPGKELEYVKFSRIEQPSKVFFYKKKDGEGDIIEDSEIFACKEQEAGMFGKFHKLIGVGDGKTYYATLKNAKVTEVCYKCMGSKTVEQAISNPVDGKTIMERKPCEACNGLGNTQKTLRAGMVIPVSEARRVLQEAFDAELEGARGKKEKPVYQHVSIDDTILRHKNSAKIIDGLNFPTD